MINPKPGSPQDVLEHHGVKGMKWGQRRVNRLERVGFGSGSKTDKARVVLTEVSKNSIKKHGGLQGAAASKATRIKARKARINRGEATIKDLLANYGGDRLVDLG